MGEVEVESLRAEDPPVAFRFRMNRRARRYILRVGKDGLVSLTIPRFGSKRAGLAFAEQHKQWIRLQLEKARSQQVSQAWKPGTTVFVDGEPAVIRVIESAEGPTVGLGDDVLCAFPGEGCNLRPLIEGHLWGRARKVLTERVVELAAKEDLQVRRVSVRNQRSRWGSCSRRGTISLNWRLIQTPDFVRDYIILHELAHLQHMNHSDAFWAEVLRMCPDYMRAEAWLKANHRLLR
jgi:predicted metal-dependent hydrolase